MIHRLDLDSALDSGEARVEKPRTSDRRDEQRLPIKLKVAIVYHQHKDEATRPTFHGVTNDISMLGLSVLVDYNIFNEGEVTVLLAVPPEHPGGTQKIIEATAKMVYTVYSAESNSFRVGMLFRSFKRNGMDLLSSVRERCSYSGNG